VEDPIDGAVDVTCKNITNEAIELIFFQKNQAMSDDSLAIIWRKESPPPEGQSVFHFPIEITSYLMDSLGITTPNYNVEYGQMWEAYDILGSYGYRYYGESASPELFSILNNYSKGWVSGYLLRDNDIFARKLKIKPLAYGLFSFDHSITIAVFNTTEYAKGDVVNYQQLETAMQDIDFSGISNLELVISGSVWGGYTINVEISKYY